MASVTSRGTTTTTVFPTGYLALSTTTFYNAFQSFASANSACDVTLTGTNSDTLYSSCACSALTYGKYDGVTFSQYSYSASLGQTFTPVWPGDDPYVTSVGATTVQNKVEVRNFSENSGCLQRMLTYFTKYILYRMEPPKILRIFGDKSQKFRGKLTCTDRSQYSHRSYHNLRRWFQPTFFDPFIPVFLRRFLVQIC